jgi:hypothetical protein
MYYQSHKDYYKNRSKQYYQENKQYFKKLNTERYYKQQGLLEKYKIQKVNPNVVTNVIIPESNATFGDKHDKPIYSYRNYKKNKIENDLKKNAEKAEQFKMQLLNQNVSPNK